MRTHHLIFFILIFLLAGCTLKQKSPIVYTRTKDIRLNGQTSAFKGERMLSVTWEYAKQKIVQDNIKPDEELQDCFRSEIIYDGISDNTINFLVKNYICGAHTPLNSEPITYELKLPALIKFHSIHLKILTADNSKLVFESL